MYDLQYTTIVCQFICFKDDKGMTKILGLSMIYLYIEHYCFPIYVQIQSHISLIIEII